MHFVSGPFKCYLKGCVEWGPKWLWWNIKIILPVFYKEIQGNLKRESRSLSKATQNFFSGTSSFSSSVYVSAFIHVTVDVPCDYGCLFKFVLDNKANYFPDCCWDRHGWSKWYTVQHPSTFVAQQMLNEQKTHSTLLNNQLKQLVERNRVFSIFIQHFEWLTYFNIQHLLNSRCNICSLNCVSQATNLGNLVL